MPVVSIINNQLDWHLFDKPFNGIFLPVIKVIDYFKTPSMSHLHIFFIVLATKYSSIAGMFSYKLIFLFVITFLLSSFSLIYCFIYHPDTLYVSGNSFSL